jgi:hypothetical protein
MKIKISGYLIFIAAVLFINTTAAPAKPLTVEAVPAPLKPWVDWVSRGNEHKRCPFLFSSFDQHICAWPDQLQLKLHSSGGQFTQRWHVYEESWLTLPGEARYWPVDVTLNNKTAVVISRDGAPVIQVPAGDYTVKGQFQWPALPKSLAIAKSTALLSVTLEDKTVDFPRIDDGR